jgi:hypothetical protein
MLTSHQLLPAWSSALSYWRLTGEIEPPAIDNTQSEMARIDVGTRLVTINGKLVDALKLGDCLEAILAHELGHIIRYPGTLANYARLRLLERQVIPLPRMGLAVLSGRFEQRTSAIRELQANAYSFVNLFTDLMINARLGSGPFQTQVVRVYQAYSKRVLREREQSHEPFMFVLMMYEEMWSLPPGALCANPLAPSAAIRAEAQVLAERLRRLKGNIYAEFLCFLGTIMRFGVPEHYWERFALDRMALSRVPNEPHAEPSIEDWAGALTPAERERTGVQQAISENWFDYDSPSTERFSPDPRVGRHERERLLSMATEDRITGLPGYGTDNADQIPIIMAAYYRREASRYFLPPARNLAWVDDLVPIHTDDWQIGDDIQEIDWISSLSLRGPHFGAILPLKRLRAPEFEASERPVVDSRLELYLDVGGAAPDPRATSSPMTLAAQILATTVTRSGGAVRQILYSNGPVLQWRWTRSEVELSSFLMHYVGGDSVFPFSTLEQSLHESGRLRPFRVVITTETVAGVDGLADSELEILRAAVQVSQTMYFFLYRPDREIADRLRSIGANVLEIPDVAEFPRFAAEVANAIQAHNEYAW